MFKILKISITVITIILNSCSFFESLSYPYYYLEKKDAEFKDLFFFYYRKKLYGIDPDSFEIKAILKFGTFIEYGDMSPDGTIFVGHLGPHVGASGKGLYVITPDGKLKHKLDTPFLNPDYIIYNNGKLFVSSQMYILNVPLLVLDVNNNFNVLLYETNIFETSPSIITYKNIVDSNIYFSCWGDEIGDKSFYPSLVKMDVNTLNYTKITNCFPYFDTHLDSYVYKDLIITYSIDFQEVYIYNSHNYQLITNYKFFEIADIPYSIKTNEEYKPKILSSLLLYFSAIINNDLILMYLTYGDFDYLKLLIVDLSNFNYKGEINIDRKKYDIFRAPAKYIKNNKIFFEQGSKIFVFDYEKKDFIKIIQLPIE